MAGRVYDNSCSLCICRKHAALERRGQSGANAELCGISLLAHFTSLHHIDTALLGLIDGLSLADICLLLRPISFINNNIHTCGIR
jgi:hypothetical protein